jgi:L-arabinose transport system substrate-binding protein
MRLWKNLIVASAADAKDVKIGFVWFQDEWKFADAAAKEKGFTLVKAARRAARQPAHARDGAARLGPSERHAPAPGS